VRLNRNLSIKSNQSMREFTYLVNRNRKGKLFNSKHFQPHILKYFFQEVIIHHLSNISHLKLFYSSPNSSTHQIFIKVLHILHTITCSQPLSNTILYFYVGELILILRISPIKHFFTPLPRRNLVT